MEVKEIKKTPILLIIVAVILALNINVMAESILELNDSLEFDTNADDSGNHINKIYIASGKKLEFTIEGTTSEMSWGVGDEAVLIQKERVQSIKVNISASSGVLCTVKNLKSGYYTLSNNTFTLKDNTTATSNLKGNIGGISCSFPTTNEAIKLSSSNYLTIVLETTDVDIVSEPYKTKKSTETYKYQFGVINENYVKSLNNTLSITSATVDGQASQGFKIIEVDKPSVTLKVVQNNLASKNKVYLTVDSEKQGEIIKKQELKTSEKVINLPYGAVEIEVLEVTEKELYLNNLIGNESYDDIGFANDTLTSSHKTTSFIYNRLDNRSKVNTLKSLNISDVTIAFKSELKNYVATVPYKVASVTVNSLLTDPKSSYVSGFGNRTVNLKEGTNDVQIKVKAENESVAVYTVKINREKNDDATLKSITVNDKEISIKDGLLVYSTKVENEVVKPTIKAVPNDSKAKVEVEKFKDLVEGDNEISITVTASNGTKKVYVINVIRDTLISTNSKLKNLEVKGQDIGFDTEKTEYQVHINYDIDKLDLVVEPEHEKAKYIVTGNKDLKNGSVVKVKVTAEDGETITTYTINVEKEKRPFNILFVIIPGIILLVGLVVVLMRKKKNKVNEPSNNVSETVADVPKENTDVNFEPQKHDAFENQNIQEENINSNFEPKIIDVPESSSLDQNIEPIKKSE